MSFLFPTGLLFAVLAVPVLLLYMLKIRRPVVRVPSTLLWSMVMRDQRANTPWQRLQRNLLLLLQLLILAGLVLAVARPALPAPGLEADALYVLLDASASMQATDVGPTRFEAGKQAVRRLIDGMRPGTRMTLILVGEQPQVLASRASDRSLLLDALEQAQPESGRGGWSAALALAAAAVAREPGEVVAVIVSDGGLGGEPLPSFPGEIQYLPIGERDDNLAISAMASRATPSGVELFLQLENYGTEPRQAVLSLYVDSQWMSSQRVELAGGESRGVLWQDAPTESAVYQARLTSTGDAPLDSLALDDVAFTVHRAGRQRRALLFPYSISPLRYNFFVERALLAMEEVEAFRAVPSEEGALLVPDDPFDLYVIDGLWPQTTPAGNLLILNPPENPLFQVGEASPVTFPVRVHEHELTRFVDWQDVYVSQARRIQVPEGSRALVEADDLPLVILGQDPSRRLAVLSFDLHDSNLPLQVAFPILFANLTNFLAPPRPIEAPNLRPGEALVMHPPPEVTQVTIVTPSGKTVAIDRTQQGFVFSATRELGLYRVEFSSPTERRSDRFAVNLLQPEESQIRPASGLEIGAARISGRSTGGSGEREIWPWLAAGALLIAVIEWWIERRGELRPIGGSRGSALLRRLPPAGRNARRG